MDKQDDERKSNDEGGHQRLDNPVGVGGSAEQHRGLTPSASCEPEEAQGHELFCTSDTDADAGRWTHHR